MIYLWMFINVYLWMFINVYLWMFINVNINLWFIYECFMNVDHDLFMYVIAMKDESVGTLVAKYCFDVLTNFDKL
jgi:hypothetical protein